MVKHTDSIVQGVKATERALVQAREANTRADIAEGMVRRLWRVIGGLIFVLVILGAGLVAVYVYF